MESLVSSLHHHYYPERLRNSKSGRKDMESLATLFYHHYYPQGLHWNVKGGRKDVESLVSYCIINIIPRIATETQKEVEKT